MWIYCEIYQHIKLQFIKFKKHSRNISRRDV